MAVIVTKTFTTVCPGELKDAINANPSIGPNLEQIVYAGGATTDFYFASALSGPEDTELDSVLAGWSCPSIPTETGDGVVNDSGGPDADTMWSSEKITNDFVNTSGDNMTGTLNITTTGSTDQLVLDSSTATTHWEVNAGRSGFFDQWLLFKNENESDSFSFAITNSGQFRGKKGSAGAPTYSFYSFGGDPDGSNYGMSFQPSGPKSLVLSSEGIPRLRVEEDGTLNVAGTANYETLVLADDDIPNKKYVDDKLGDSYYFDAYDNAGGQTFTTGTITVNIDTVRENTGFSLASDVVTVINSGLYIIAFRVSTEISSGSARSTSKAWLELDTGGGFSEVDGSRGFMYNRNSTAGDNSCSITVVLDLSAGDQLRIRANRIAGGAALITQADGSGITITPVGANGPPGPPGSGSEINIEDSGTPVAGTPHSILNFVNASVTNVDGDTVDIDVGKTIRLGHTWAISGEIKVPSGDDDFIIPFFVSLPSGQTAKIAKCRYKINSGTSVTCKLQKNDVDVTGFTGMSITTTAATTDASDVTLADDDKVALVVTGVSGSPTNMTFTLFIDYTV